MRNREVGLHAVVFHQDFSFTRRQLLFASFLGAGLPALASDAASRNAAPSTGKTAKKAKRAKTVKIATFDSSGRRTGVEVMDKITKTDEEWKKELPSLTYDVTSCQGTERAFSGKYTDFDGDGLYRCARCGTVLFDSKTKYHSGSGWPSYYQPIARENITEKVDFSLGMRRVEILCSRCGAHLGHVFDDGPQPTGMRYCLNSAALDFATREVPLP